MEAERERTWRVGDRVGFVRFYDDTFTEAYRYAGRLCGSDRGTAEDLVQDTYLALLRRAKAGALDELTIGYLVTSLRHRFLDRLRGEGREQRRLELVPAPADSPPPSEPVSIAGLASLPARDRAALVLRYVDDLPVAEVAAALDLSVRATESLLVRARARLRDAEVRDA